jgi:hypothetical protein
MAEFQLPKHGINYTRSVFARCDHLIDFGVWSGIEKIKLDAWKNNFKSNEELYFCAKLLDCLIYRSESQSIALMKQVFQVKLIELGRRIGSNPLINSFKTLRAEENEPKIRIIPVIPKHAPPGKSGPTIARSLKRFLGIRQNWMLHAEHLKSNKDKIEVLIFIDDFLGTGLQFHEFMSEFDFYSLGKSIQLVYAPLVGHETATETLSAFPNLYVTPGEVLDERHSFFSPSAEFFEDGVNSSECALHFYHQLLQDREIELEGKNRQGFGGLEVLYAFQNAVPDNSLPLLWWDKSPKWTPLFNR